MITVKRFGDVISIFSDIIPMRSGSQFRGSLASLSILYITT